MEVIQLSISSALALKSEHEVRLRQQKSRLLTSALGYTMFTVARATHVCVKAPGWGRRRQIPNHERRNAASHRQFAVAAGHAQQRVGRLHGQQPGMIMGAFHVQKRGSTGESAVNSCVSTRVREANDLDVEKCRQVYSFKDVEILEMRSAYAQALNYCQIHEPGTHASSTKAWEGGGGGGDEPTCCSSGSLCWSHRSARR